MVVYTIVVSLRLSGLIHSIPRLPATCDMYRLLVEIVSIRGLFSPGP